MRAVPLSSGSTSAGPALDRPLGRAPYRDGAPGVRHMGSGIEQPA